MSLKKDIIGAEVQIGTNQAQQNLTELAKATAELNSENKALLLIKKKLEVAGKKDSAEYKKATADLKANRLAVDQNKNKMKEYQKTLGVTSLTMSQLRLRMRDTRRQLSNTVPNTKAWDKYNKELQETQAQYNKLNAKTRQTKGFLTKLKGAAGGLLPAMGLAAIVTMIGRVGKEMFNLTKQIQGETIRATTVLGDQMGYVESQADKLAEKMGVTNREFVSMVANTGDLLIPLDFSREAAAKMATQVQGLSGALDEWTAGKYGVAEVSNILTKAMLGENEQLKQLGIAIRKDTDEFRDLVKQKMADEGATKIQAEALATLSLLYKKSADAQAAYSREGNKLLRWQKEVTLWWRNMKEGAANYFIDSAADKLIGERKQVNALAVELTNANTQEDRRYEILEELNRINPKITAGLDAENIAVETLKNNMKLYNEELANRIVLANLTDAEEEEAAKVAKQMEKVAGLQYEIDQIILDTDENVALSNITMDEKIKKTLELLKIQKEAEGYAPKNSVFTGGVVASGEIDELFMFKTITSNLADSQEKLNKATANQTDFSKRIEGMKELLGLSSSLQTLSTPTLKNKTPDENEALKAIEVANQQRILLLKEQYGAEETMQEFLHARLLANELAFLQAKLKLAEDEGDKLVLQTQIVDKQNQYNTAVKSAVDALRLKETAVEAVNTKLLEEGKLTQRNAQVIAEAAKEQEELNKRLTSQAEMYQDTIGLVSQGLFDMMSGSEDAFQSFAKNILIFALEQLKVQAQIAAAGATIQSLASPESIATFGAAGLAKAALIVGLIEAAFAGIEGLVSNAFSGKGKKSGGYGETGASDDEVKGVYHANEFIASAPAVRNPSVKQVLDIIDLAQRSGTVATLNLPAVIGAGRKTGGYATQPQVEQQAITPATGESDIDIQNLTKALNRFADKQLIVDVQTIQKKMDKLTEMKTLMGM